MAEENKLIPREISGNGSVDVLASSRALPPFDLSPREPHLYDYLLILRKHQWLILTFLLTVVTIVSIATFRMRPVYIATETIEIDSENSNILPFQGADSYDYMMDLDNYIETQARQTIRNTDLSSNSELSNGQAQSQAIARGTLANQKRPPEVAAFLGSLGVKRVPNSRLLEVSYESTDPVYAAKILNAHIENFKQQNIQSRYESTLEATRFLTNQLNELKQTVKQSEDARINYERQNQIWSVDDKSNITTQRLAELDKQLTDAQGETLKKQALYEYAKAGDIEAVPEVRSNAVLQDLQKRRSDLAVQYTEAVSQYGPNFPKVQRLQAQIKETDEQIAKENKGIVLGLESDYREAKQKEELIRQALDQQKAETNNMAEKLVQYNILKRESEADKALYEGLLTKLKEAGISEGLKSSNVRVVDPAMIPSYPARPAKARNIALAFLVGLVGGIGLALLREYLDNTVKTPDDVEMLARLPS